VPRSRRKTKPGKEVRKMAKRDTTRYHLKEPGGRIVHRGITDRHLEEREQEHQAEYPGTTATKIGPKVTRESALRWEREGGKRL
jgi:hypothetical protein